MIQRVIKFGGSLLDAPELQQNWRLWFQQQPPATNIVIAGGGAMVDSIRTWQNANGSNDAFCHWLSIDAMSLTARWLHKLIDDSELTRNIDDLNHCKPGIVVFDAADWLRTLKDLPESWNVSSDSIAARLARAVRAEELVLLKSSLPQCRNTSMIECVQAGFVDRHFPVAATGLPRIRIVNLRSVNQEMELVAS